MEATRATLISEKFAAVRELQLNYGDIVEFTNYIHRRVRVEIIDSTFHDPEVSTVKVLDDGQFASVGLVEFIDWLLQPDTVITRIGRWPVIL
ncbi:MAG: hypothetical protein IJL93_07870 [Bacteroidales bacterium]|nr:hypothetical protein [Bacteroidales bacterium]